MTKILIIGDPHGSDKIKDIPFEGVDLILLTGDLGKADKAREYFFKYNVGEKVDWKTKVSKEEIEAVFNEKIYSAIDILKFTSQKAPTYFVLGNVEDATSEDVDKVNAEYGTNIPFWLDLIKDIPNIYLLNNSVKEFNNLKIAGVGFAVEEQWVERFMPGNVEKLGSARKQEPPVKNFLESLDQVDILLSHIPPLGCLDHVTNPKAPKIFFDKDAGSIHVLNYIKRANPKYVVCGHIHEQKGEEKLGETQVINAGFNGDYKILEL